MGYYYKELMSCPKGSKERAKAFDIERLSTVTDRCHATSRF